MRAAFVAIALCSASIAVFFACSADTPATPEGSDSGRAEAGESEGSVEDAGGPDVLRAPTGCPLKTTSYVSGAKAENLPRTDINGAVDWTNVSGALSEDGKFATVTLAENQESAELRVSQFGLEVPAGAETWGIEVELKRRAPDGGIEDSRVDFAVEGKTVTWKYLKGPWPMSIVGTHEYGQAVDTWGVDLFPSDVNKATFAAKLWVRRAAGAAQGPVTATVDSLKVAVYYCTK